MNEIYLLLIKKFALPPAWFPESIINLINGFKGVKNGTSNKLKKRYGF